MIRSAFHPPAIASAALELALADGDMRLLDWLAAVRAAAAAGLDQLILSGPHPRHHRAAHALWECATACGMRVTIIDTPPQPAGADARIRIASDGIPRLLIPAGIPIAELPPALGLTLAGIASPPVLRALQAASAWQPDQPHRP